MTNTLVMSAPNGARKTKQDHPRLPITINETIAAAIDAHQAGASILHAHVRDDDGQHSLDHGRYKDLLAGMAAACPGMPCQITTEAVGRYTPQQQLDCLLAVAPDFASLAIREITADGPDIMRDAATAATDLNIHLQYILYDLDDLVLLRRLYDDGVLQEKAPDILYVLGKYNPNFTSHPDELDPFLDQDLSFTHSWMVCAFGAMEYDVMAKAAQHGGHARIGFENNLFMKDGSLAADNAALITQFTGTHKPARHVDDVFNR